MSESKQDYQVRKALSEAVEALYFDDGSDYATYLWKIVEILGGKEAVDLLEKHDAKAYIKYVELEQEC